MDRPWTPDLVEERLVEAFRELLREPAAAFPGQPVRANFTRQRLSGAELIRAANILLAAAAVEEEKSALFCWAKNRADYDVQGVTIRAMIERRGWSRQTFENKKRRGARLVFEGIRAFVALTGGEHAGEQAASAAVNRRSIISHHAATGAASR